MGNLADSAGVILSRIERRVEVASHNVANATTAGYKRAVSFDNILHPQALLDLNPSDNDVVPFERRSSQFAIDLTPGQPQDTGNPDDLAILGAGFFSVRSRTGESLLTRQGLFRHDADGHLVTASGGILQQYGGGDLTLQAGDFKVLEDGTVLQSGEVRGRIAVVDLLHPEALGYAEGGLLTAPEGQLEVMEEPSIRQGALEASNVSLGSELITIMAALREAQSAQRIVGIYDSLLGRAVAVFGQT